MLGGGERRWSLQPNPTQPNRADSTKGCPTHRAHPRLGSWADDANQTVATTLKPGAPLERGSMTVRFQVKTRVATSTTAKPIRAIKANRELT